MILLRQSLLIVIICFCVALNASYAQVVIKERVEVEQSPTVVGAFTGIGFVAPSDGTLEIDLMSAFRAGFELFTDIPEFVLLQVFVNEEEVLSDNIFSRNWSVVTTPNQVVCGPSVLPGQTYTGSETIIVGDVVAGDEVTLRFVTPFAVYGALIDFDLDSSIITENGEEWSVDFIGNGRAEFVDFLLQCTIPREELSLTVRYGSGIPGPDIVYLVENPTTQELEATNHLGIGHWENAYALDSEGSLVLVDGNPVVKNDDTDNFITADPDRFYIQVTDPVANVPDEDGNPVQNFITVQLETLLPDGSMDDIAQTLVLGESDVDTGVFQSAPQLLVTQDVAMLPDDGFEANNNMGSFMEAYEAYATAEGLPLAGNVADNEATDPTHKATVGGSVQVRYGLDEVEETRLASVCNPSDIKEVELNFIIYNEPFIDGGFIDSNEEFVAGVDGEFDWEGKNYSIPFVDAYAAYLANPNVPSEAYIDFSTPPEERAGVIPKSGVRQKTGSSWGPVYAAEALPDMVDKLSSVWAQSCLTFSWSSTVADPPQDIMIDGRLDLLEDPTFLEAPWFPILVDDVIDVFIVGDNDQGYGGVSIAYTWAVESGEGWDGVIDLGDVAYIIMSPLYESSESRRDLILPHEVGHMITNLQVPDSQSDEPAAPEFIIFPRLDLGEDDHYGKRRRITKETESQKEGSPYLKSPN